MKRIAFAAIALLWLAFLPSSPALAACSGGTNTHSCFYTTAGSNTAPYDTEAKACTTLAACITQMAAGDTLFVVNTSAGETGPISVTFPGTAASPNFIYNVATGGTTITAGGSGAGAISTTGNNSITFNGVAIFESVYISSGTGANGVSFFSGNSGNDSFVYLNSKLVLGGTAGGTIRGISPYNRLYNTSIKFNATGSSIFMSGKFIWLNGSYDASAAIPTTLFLMANSGANQFFLEGVDLSAITSGTLISNDGNAGPASMLFKDVKLNAGATIAAAQTGPEGYNDIVLLRTDSAGASSRNERHNPLADMTTVTTVVRTGGASDGVPVSWNIKTTARASWSFPFAALPMSLFSVTTGANVALTVEGICSPRDCSALPTNDLVWFDIEYLGAGSSPLGSFQTGTKANNLASGSALTASSAAWDSQATAWAATTAYGVGTIRKFATCSGQLYQVTAVAGTGTSGGSQPACQSDGGSVVDNAGGNQITWKAFWRFNQTVTLSSPQPGLSGPITIYPKVGATSLTDGYWIDPVPTVAGVTLGKTFALSPGVYVDSLGGTTSSHITGSGL